MSFQVGSQCFDSADSALAYMAASMYGAGSNNGATTSFYSYVDGSTIVTLNSDNQSTVIQPVLQNCQLINAVDAGIYSWTVFAILAIAWKFRVMGSAVHANRSGD